MNPVIFIPARMASTRLPDKPLAMVGDAPMVVQVWRRAIDSGVGDVVVACDGEKIAGAIEQAGGIAIITDPGLPSGSDRIYAALDIFDPKEQYDVVVNVQGDMPALDPAIIRRTVSLLDDPAVDIGTLAAALTGKEEKNDPAVVKVIISPSLKGRGDMRGRALSFSRTWMPNAYHHIGIYAYRRAALEKFVSLPPSPLELREKLEQLRAMEAGMRIEVAIVDTVPLGVDTPEGLEKARQYYEKK